MCVYNKFKIKFKNMLRCRIDSKNQLFEYKNINMQRYRRKEGKEGNGKFFTKSIKFIHNLPKKEKKKYKLRESKFF